MIALKKVYSQPTDYSLALKNWLSGEASGHLGPYLYINDKNDNRWKSGHSGKSYYFSNDEKATFDLAIQQLGITANHLIDFGPGGDASVTSKSIPIANRVMAKEYYAVDMSYALSKAAAELVSNNLDIPSTDLVADFFSPINISKQNSLLMMLGGTLGNIETHQNLKSLLSRLHSIFYNFRKMVDDKSHLLISIDTNTNSEEVIECYDNNQLESLIRGSISSEIDTTNFKYEVTWNEKTKQLAMGLRSDIDQIINYEGDQFAIEKNEFLAVLNSYRYSIDLIKNAAEYSGWSLNKTWSATGRVNYLLFSSK